MPRKSVSKELNNANKSINIEAILSLSVTEIATNLWINSKDSSNNVFSEAVVKKVLVEELVTGNKFQFQFLDLSGYLENYLWPHLTSLVTNDHIYSIILLVNEKVAQDSPVFAYLVTETSKFSIFIEKIVDGLLNDVFSELWLTNILKFFTNCFRSFEYEIVKKSLLRYLSMPIWEHLSQEGLSAALQGNSFLKDNWSKYIDHKRALNETNYKNPENSKRKRNDMESEELLISMKKDSNFFPKLLTSFFQYLKNSQNLDFIITFVELLAEILSQISPRKFLIPLLIDLHFPVKCKLSSFYAVENVVFYKFVDLFDYYFYFPVNNASGKEYNSQQIIELTNDHVSLFQQTAFSLFGQNYKDIIFTSLGELSKKDNLINHLAVLSPEDIFNLASSLKLIHDKDQLNFNVPEDIKLIHALIIDFVIPKKLSQSVVDNISVYPTEDILWDHNVLPLNSTDSTMVPLPRSNLQFLSINDYLIRNFILYRWESYYEIRNDLMDSVKRMGPLTAFNGNVNFQGWSRMALPLSNFKIDSVSSPILGETIPSKVECSLIIDLSRFTGSFLEEWESIKEHDVLFLVTIESPTIDLSNKIEEFERDKALLTMGKTPNKNEDYTESDIKEFTSKYGVKFVRGGEIIDLQDEANVVLNDFSRPDDRISRTGKKRKLRLRLDPAQYYNDIQAGKACYDGFNLIVRRKPSENNFKPILETIKGLIRKADSVKTIPIWLNDTILGTSESTRSFNSTKQELNVFQTFVDSDHILEAFPDCSDIQIKINEEFFPISTLKEKVSSPFKFTITFDDSKSPKQPNNKFSKAKFVSEPPKIQSIKVTPYQVSSQSPLYSNKLIKQSVRFTPNQSEAILSGMIPGLSLIVGPPGTGKTDVAVQIISNLYNAHPTQKILIVTHSNAALNDIFEKIIKLDVHPRHLLRLGSGESSLRESLTAHSSTDSYELDFSKEGRVNYCLYQRLRLLGLTQQLAISLGVPGDIGQSCETARYFFENHVVPRIQVFSSKFSKVSHEKISSQEFPFSQFFADSNIPLFLNEKPADDNIIQRAILYIQSIFAELEEYRPLELLRTQSLRGEYLINKQARILAMTCTHAAINREKLVQSGFKFDSIIMEEAGQILEVETLIPMLLQDAEALEQNRLKRVVLLGDHLQLPPIVKNGSIQKYCKLEQSMFSRFIRIGIPIRYLNAQGRSRPELASLYNWKYANSNLNLQNMPIVTHGPYSLANTGFVHTYQFIDVPNFQGKGETCPTPFFYQNVGEAEYIVAVYQYMRLMGYPAEKISIITTYNGQKSLIEDILERRCLNPLFGMPRDVSTVDKFQGRQNDYILLSLVRTESIGHLRDFRRLVVALSRAKLGLYVFGRKSLFETCFELLPAFNKLFLHPHKLQLLGGESYPTSRLSTASSDLTSILEVEDVTSMGVLIYQMVQQSQHLITPQM